MKEAITEGKSLSPASILWQMEQGAQAIHDLPYRFAAWLPTAPEKAQGLAQRACQRLSATRAAALCQQALAWLTQQADTIHELPYRLWAWLPTLVPLWHTVLAKALVWMDKKDITPRVKIMAPLCAAVVILTVCTLPIEQGSLTYLLTSGAEPEIILGFPETEQELNGLSIDSASGGRDAQLVLAEGQTISIRADGETRTITSRRETVANLLRRADVECDEDEMVVVNISGQSPSIAIQRVYSYDWQKTVPISYEREYVKDPLLEKGKEVEVHAGQVGSILQTYRNIYRQGELTSSELVSEVVTEPISQVFRQGTRVDEVSRSDRIEKVVYNDDGSGYLLFRSGDTMTFSRRVTCNATAYSIGNWTASGLPTKVGHIAVDPSVFPYHTRFYIYTNDGYLVYGNAVAADCGTSIKGNKIDLWFETYAEACNFGRRDCTVFVLD